MASVETRHRRRAALITTGESSGVAKHGRQWPWPPVHHRSKALSVGLSNNHFKSLGRKSPGRSVGVTSRPRRIRTRTYSGGERASQKAPLSRSCSTSGCRWCDYPPEYGPPTAIYNRLCAGPGSGVWENLFRELMLETDDPQTTQMVSKTLRMWRASLGSGRKEGRSRLLASRLEGATRSAHMADAKGAPSRHLVDWRRSA